MTPLTTRIRAGRIAYFFFAAIFAACILAQFFLAGMASFVHPNHWLQHVTFIHLFGFSIPLLLLIFALIGSMPRRVYWQLLALFFFIFAMYFSANMVHLPLLRAMHPVLAVLLLGAAVHNVQTVYGLMARHKGGVIR